MKALDLFCGAGGASMGLHQAGFQVTGVDIAPQKNYPFEFIQDDALKFALKNYYWFDFIWASPPCQAFSLAQRIQNNKHPDWIGPIRELLKASEKPWCIENVVGAPLKSPTLLCGTMFKGLSVYRHRIFETSFSIREPLHPAHKHKLAKMGRPPKPGEFIHVVGNFSGIELARKAMGINWMNRDELREAIPPAYSKFIAEQWLKTQTQPNSPLP